MCLGITKEKYLHLIGFMRRFILFALLAIILLIAAFFYYSQRAKDRDYIQLFGNVDVRQVDLGFRVSGRVEKMFFEEGTLVQPGTLMAVLDKQPYTDQVEQAIAAMESAQVSFQNAEKLLKRREELIGDGSVSQEDLENILASRDVSAANLKQSQAALGIAKSNLSYTEVFAPSEGVILTRIREPGTVVREADPIYTLSLTAPVWVRAFISEPDLGRVYPNMPAEIFTDTPGGTVYHGHVGFISPLAEFTPKTVETMQLRTDLVYRLRIIAENPDHGLRQGMPVTVKLKLKKSEEDKR